MEERRSFYDYDNKIAFFMLLETIIWNIISATFQSLFYVEIIEDVVQLIGKARRGNSKLNFLKVLS